MMFSNFYFYLLYIPLISNYFFYYSIYCMVLFQAELCTILYIPNSLFKIIFVRLTFISNNFSTNIKYVIICSFGNNTKGSMLQFRT